MRGWAAENEELMKLRCRRQHCEVEKHQKKIFHRLLLAFDLMTYSSTSHLYTPSIIRQKMKKLFIIALHGVSLSWLCCWCWWQGEKRGSRVWMICSQNLTLNLFWRSSRLNLKSYVICLLCSESTRKRNEIIPFRPSLVRLRGLCQLTSCHSLVPPLSSSLTMEYHPPEYVVYEKSSEKVSRWWSMSSFKPEKCNIFFLYRTTTRKLNSLVDEEQILPQPKRI